MRPDQKGSLFISGGTLLHLDPPRVEKAEIVVREGQITGVGSSLTMPMDCELVDASNRWIMPGLVVAHHHLYSALACGMPLPEDAPADFADMLDKVWWRLDRALDPDSVEVSGLVGGLQCLRAGVTTVVDHHASPSFIDGSLELLDGALDGLGLRRVLSYEVTNRGGREQAREGLLAHANLLAQDGGGKRAIMVGAHANFTLTDETLKACGSLASEAGTGLHIHVAEAMDDRQRVGEPLVQRMQRLGALVEGSILAHCVHLDSDSLRRVADAGAWVTHQPRSNMNNGVGYAPVEHFPDRTALGTDGIGADLFSELQSAWFRAQEAGVSWSPNRWLQCLSRGADLAGDRLGVRLGRIERGAAADLVFLDPVPGPPLSDENLAAAFIFRLSAAAVRDVVVDGNWLLRDRQPTGLSASEIDARAMATAPRLWERMRCLD
jgi:cytosine/adenosine deaminase-related metal-dependent hydrolase